MLSSQLCAAKPAVCILMIAMAQVAAHEDGEKTTALKDLLSRIDLDELMKKDEPPFTFPQTLEEFEYAFNEHGQLRHTKTGEHFIFNAREDLHRWNQKRYEALGEVIHCQTEAARQKATLKIITQYVYELLENKCNMTKAIIPVDAAADEPSSFIYLSPDALSNPSKLLVLIQGSGVVRAGQWARRLIINQDLDSGTQIPFITRAMEENASSEEHVLYVWDHFVAKAAAKHVFVVAHSYGGLSFVELLNHRETEVRNKVCAVALTDSAHSMWLQDTSKSTQDWMQQHCCNWVSSPEPLDTPLDSMLPDCPRVSAGTERHELTSWMSFESIFRFFGEVVEAKEDEETEETSNIVTTRSSSLKSKHLEL
ncbi:cotranscriptional regulator ARB2A homolog isoform X5 [Corythoichthys intestinalis]|uniref:cotranscriptional regulator ARB2A homolog isoform X5 n=1 Tax=Corythoichthys intestinalis TaxID=161448 RepID=UPI0025A66D24|nr:cotranscriptional regulator FAM172A homolog isoform X5 [Corythoichthys intestinalis]